MRISTSKTFFFIVLVSPLLFACEKDKKDQFALDKTMYLTIQTGGKTYTSYGYTNNQESDMFGGPELSLVGQMKAEALFVATNKIESGINTVEFEMGNSYADLYMTRPDTVLSGPFTTFVGNQASQVIRLGDPEQEFWFDKNGFVFTITAQGTHNNRPTYEGNFSGMLHLATDTTVKQSATATFRAYLK